MLDMTFRSRELGGQEKDNSLRAKHQYSYFLKVFSQSPPQQHQLVSQAVRVLTNSKIKFINNTSYKVILYVHNFHFYMMQFFCFLFGRSLSCLLDYRWWCGEASQWQDKGQVTGTKRCNIHPQLILHFLIYVTQMHPTCFPLTSLPEETNKPTKIVSTPLHSDHHRKHPQHTNTLQLLPEGSRMCGWECSIVFKQVMGGGGGKQC